MKILEDEGFCTCCGAHGEYQYGEENYSLLKKDLENYKRYKDIFVYECPNCGFVSTDITNEEGVLYGPLRKNKEFKEAYNLKYLKNLDKELYAGDFSEIPVNLYEAYSYVLEKSGDFEKKIRVLCKCIYLKEVMLRNYHRGQAELGGEEENDDEYEEFYTLLNQSINKNIKEIISCGEKITNLNLYDKLIIAESFIKLGKKAEAGKIVNDVISKNHAKEDLKKYFETLMKEGE